MIRPPRRKTDKSGPARPLFLLPGFHHRHSNGTTAVPNITVPVRAQIKAAADRAEARSRGIVDEPYGEDWERGFNDKCDQAKRDHDRDSGVYEAEIARLALLSPDFDYQF